MKKFVYVILSMFILFGCSSNKVLSESDLIEIRENKLNEQFTNIHGITVDQVGNSDGSHYQSFKVYLPFDNIIAFDFTYDNGEEYLDRIVVAWADHDDKEDLLELGLQSFLNELSNVTEDEKNDFYKEVTSLVDTYAKEYETRNMFFRSNASNFVFKTK